MKYDRVKSMENIDSSTRKNIIHFLEDITTRLKNRKSSHDEERTVCEFYMKCMKNESISIINEEDDCEKNHMKYFTLGWYIYENFLKNHYNHYE